MIVVTGATGNVGRTLVQVLASAGEQVTAVSRRPPALPAGIRHHQADLADPSSLEPALNGADSLFLLVGPDGDILKPQDILGVVKAAGIRRVVLQSSQGAGTRPAASSHSHLRAFEAAVQQSGLEWTVLRPGGFDSNTFAWVPMVREQRIVAAPFADIALPTIDPADIAEVGAAILRDGSHAGRTYELTGPALVSPRQQAQAIGDALGTPLQFVEQSRDEARARMLQFMPEPVVNGALDILGDPLPVEKRMSPDVEQILGRAPRPFTAWAARNIDAFK
jgi:uncharacterized protein YbjT (DUF2867 family)